MDEDAAKRYRGLAVECRAEAAKAHSPIDAAAWTKLADDFDRLAESGSRGRTGAERWKRAAN
jgi:hypothetical protein